MEGVRAQSRMAGVSSRQSGGRAELIMVVALFFVFMGGWELFVRVFQVPTYIIPAPLKIAEALLRGLFPAVKDSGLPPEPLNILLALTQNPVGTLGGLVQWVIGAVQARDGYWLHT